MALTKRNTGTGFQPFSTDLTAQEKAEKAATGSVTARARLPKQSKQIICPAGSVRNPATGKCEVINKNDGKGMPIGDTNNKGMPAGDGKIIDPKTGKFVDQGIDESKFGQSKTVPFGEGGFTQDVAVKGATQDGSYRFSGLSPEKQAQILKENEQIAQQKRDNDALLATLGTKQEEEKTSLEKKLELAQKISSSQKKLTSEKLERGAEGISAQLLKGREGVQAQANVLLAKGANAFTTKQLEIQDWKDEQINVEISEARERLQAAHDAQDLAAAESISNNIANLRRSQAGIALEKAKITSEAEQQISDNLLKDLGDNLKDQTDEQLWERAEGDRGLFQRLVDNREKLATQDLGEQAKIQRATQKQSQDFVKGLSNDQLGALTSAQATQLNTEAGLPEGTISSWVLRSQEIMKMKGDEQELENAKLQASINKTTTESNIDLAESQAKLQELNPLSFINQIPSSLSSGDMAKAVGGGVQVKPSIPGTDTSKLGNGNIILGSKWIWGLDIDGELGQDIELPGYLDGGSVVDAGNQKGFGNFIKVRDDLGREWQFSHLQDIPGLNKGDRINAGDLIGKIGNTGTVFPEPTPNNPGAGSHIDITVRQNGQEIPADQVEKLLNIGANKNRPLSKEQFSQYKDITKGFSGDAEVKSFEKSVTEGRNLIKSLNTAGGAGDMAAIFQFMKSLDPQSVVRESEFDLAAGTSGAFDIRPFFTFGEDGEGRFDEGAILTDTQRINFKKLAKEYIRNRAKVYNTKYDDMENLTQRQQIPLSTLPTNLSVDLLNEIGEKNLEDLSNDDFLNEVNITKSNNLDNTGFFGTGGGQTLTP